MFNYLKLFSIDKLFQSLFQTFGALWLFYEIFTHFFGEKDWILQHKNNWILFIAIGLVFWIVYVRPKKFLRVRIAGTDVDIEVKVKDIFSANGAMIAGCNTTFDVSVKKN